jgi:hypothetical protein
MPTSTLLAIPLGQLAVHVDAPPGTEVVLRGELHSTFDGATIDAASTTFPHEPTADTGGLIDFSSGGFYVREHDATTHVVRAIATGDGGEACAVAGVASPCLPLRLPVQARSRLLTTVEWTNSLKGGIACEVLSPPVVAPVTVRYTGVAAGALGIAAIVVAAWWARKRQATSPEGRLSTLARRVRRKLDRADPVLAAPLAPAVKSTLNALSSRHIDASSSEGQRITDVLMRVEARLDSSAEVARAHAEHAAADNLVGDVESALEAIDEIDHPIYGDSSKP